jgi:hypothetical protein
LKVIITYYLMIKAKYMPLSKKQNINGLDICGNSIALNFEKIAVIYY